MNCNNFPNPSKGMIDPSVENTYEIYNRIEKLGGDVTWEMRSMGWISLRIKVEVNGFVFSYENTAKHELTLSAYEYKVIKAMLDIFEP